LTGWESEKMYLDADRAQTELTLCELLLKDVFSVGPLTVGPNTNFRTESSREN
jgi:hypothetical protein